MKAMVLRETRRAEDKPLVLAGVTMTPIPVRTAVQPFPLREANEALLSLKRSEVNGTAVLVVGDG